MRACVSCEPSGGRETLVRDGATVRTGTCVRVCMCV